jgi:hypothetical protein
MGLTFTFFKLGKLAVNSPSSRCKLSDPHALQGIAAPEISEFNPLEASPKRYYHAKSTFGASGVVLADFVATGSVASSGGFFSITL